jgi:predicted amidohydrolase
MESLIFLFSVSLYVSSVTETAWEPVALPDGDLQAQKAGSFQPYGGAVLAEAAGPDGRKALRATVAKSGQGGLSITATPRGGMGNRVRLTITYRVTSGAPVSVFVGPNTFNQLGGRLASRQWETATLELGLLSDFHLIVHIVQPGPGVFELAEFKVEARKPEKPLSPARIGTVDVALEGHSPSDSAFGLERVGNPLPRVEWKRDQGVMAYCVTISKGTDGRIVQGMGNLPAGTRISLQCWVRVTEGGPIMFGLQSDGQPLAAKVTTASDWTSLDVTHLLKQDGQVTWFARPALTGSLEFRLAGLHAWVELPDPLAPGVVKIDGARRPICITVSDAKSIRINPPWPQIPALLCHLEYNSRWGFRFPTSHEAKIAPQNDELDLAWHFKDDPVTYNVCMKSDRPDSILVEVRLHNGGNQLVAGFSPGFCLQIAGAHSPTTFAYTIIPRAGEPFPLSMGRYFADRPEMWPNVGWVRANYTGSAAYAERVKQGPAFKPSAERWVHETGDFPMIVRRLPGRDAWIAWIWPNATGYFGNTQAPCLHMDPIVPDCPPGQTRSLFGRLVFFEGTWDSLYTLAQRERQELATRSGLLPQGSQRPQADKVRIAGIVLKWIRGDKEANFRRIEPLIRQAAAGGAQIVCTTECFLDGYAIADKSIPLNVYRNLGEPIPGGTYYKRLAALARELKIFLVAGMLEADGEARYNTAVLISPEGVLLGKYHKQLLEHELVRNRPGTTSPVFATPHGRVGLLICADRRVPEITKNMKQGGADFLLCLSGGMFGAKYNDWILQARSRETGLPIVFVHPAEFLVTDRDGSVLQQTVLGDVLLIPPTDKGMAKDANRVFYFDLPLRVPERKARRFSTLPFLNSQEDRSCILFARSDCWPSLPLWRRLKRRQDPPSATFGSGTTSVTAARVTSKRT